MLACEANARIAEMAAEAAKQAAKACRYAAVASRGRMDTAATAAASESLGQAVLAEAAAGRIRPAEYAVSHLEDMLTPDLDHKRPADRELLNELFGTDEDYDCLT